MLENKEVWRDCKGYEGKYQVSNMGRVWSATRQQYKNQRINKDGYYRVGLVAKNGKIKTEMVHRLVALAFLDKPDGCNIVNHIDGNIHNNCVDNLEWTTVQGNTKHAYDNNLGHMQEHQREITELAKKVVMLTIAVYKDNEFIGVFQGKENAAKALGINSKTIYNCIHENRRTKDGYSFEIQGGDAA